MMLLDLLASIADRGRDYLASAGQLGGERSIGRLCADLMSHRGEATGTALAREVTSAWAALDEAGQAAFFALLARDYAPDAAALEEAARAYAADPGERTLARLARAVEPPRQELIRRINMAPGGTGTIVAMRKALGALVGARPELRAVDADFQHLLSSWFNRGFLELRRVNWDTPASVLEKLIAYEAVHAIAGWDDLRRRLAPDRRCFAFFHPAMPDEPLIFVEVALTHAISDNVADILAEGVDAKAASAPSAAIFYSISNCQEGLRGISFGNFLIKQVVEELSAEMPSLRSFATLSPIPGLVAFLREEASRGAAGEGAVIEPEEAARLLEAIAEPGWPDDRERCEALRAPLSRAAARYLAEARRGNLPRDPVARFHLGNGARLERLNWLADRSPKGLRESAGLMVNYVYRLSEIERNHEALVGEGRIIASRRIRTLAA